MTLTMRIWADDPTYAVFESDYPKRDKDLIMAVPGVSYRAKADAFVAPLTWPLCLTARGVFGDFLVVAEDVQAWAWDYVQNTVTPALELRTALSYDKPSDDRLRPFQAAGVEFLKFTRRSVLGDEMGSGKTVQAAVAMRDLYHDGVNVFPMLVVAPNNMTLTWKRELNKWFPEARVTVVKGTKAQKDKLFKKADETDIWVINWESVRLHSKLAKYGSVSLKRCKVCDPNLTNAQSSCEVCEKEFNQLGIQSIIIDEAHRGKDPKSKQTRAVWKLAENCHTAFALTGTPVAKGPDDFWSILHAISPKEWPTRSKFIDRYCATQFNPWSGGLTITGLNHATEHELFKAVDPRMRRMPKSVVLPQLPPKVYVERHVDMTPKQTKAYNMMAEQMLAEIDGGVTLALNPLTMMGRLSQFASASAELTPDGSVKLTAPSSKVDVLMEVLEEMDSAPAVVFAASRQLIDLAAARLDKEGISYSLIVGGQTADQRDASMLDFQEGRKRVVLATIQAGGTGITLTRADTVIFMQRSWSNIDNKQAEDRCHRIGSEQHESITIIDLIALGTVEEHIREVLEGKKGMLEEIVRDKQAIQVFEGRVKVESIKISNSEIQTFKDCRRKWWLTYYRELALANAEDTGARALGTNIHEALASYYETGEDPVARIREIYDNQVASLLEAGKDPSKLRKDADLAFKMVEGYLEWLDETGVDSDLELLDVEQAIEYPLTVAGHDVILRGKLDARFRRKSDGATMFMDHKTCISISQLESILPMNEQMKLYHLLEYLDSKGSKWTDGALFNMLRKVKRTAAAKPPFYERVHVQHNRAQLESIYVRTLATIEEMVTAREQLNMGRDHQQVAIPRPNADCTWKCDFSAICPMFDDGSNVEGLISEYYTQQDPHERYNTAEKGE